ncbi:MAG: formylglycine-generating enzyme family protein [Deltaproteobacteria bacterium]|nr:formylglycine-generating enzyme family protein [Deltaproteobacteria bacterium]
MIARLLRSVAFFGAGALTATVVGAVNGWSGDEAADAPAVASVPSPSSSAPSSSAPSSSAPPSSAPPSSAPSSSAPPSSAPPSSAPPSSAAAQPCPATTPSDMVCVPGGEFVRGIDVARARRLGDKHLRSTPSSTVVVSTFLLDRTEVTVADWRACVAEGACRKEAGPLYADFDAPRQPIHGVSWFDAVAFCTARGKRLPTEAEWEKAARGTDGRMFPWGDEPATCARAVYRNEAGRSCGVKQRSPKNADVGRPEPVGSRPADPAGTFDLAGNSWEWVNDWFSPTWSACGAACAGIDPRGPCGGAAACPGHTERVVRGGSWYWPADHMATWFRRPHVPTNAPVFHHFGFRCARSLAP